MTAVRNPYQRGYREPDAAQRAADRARGAWPVCPPDPAYNLDELWDARVALRAAVWEVTDAFEQLRRVASAEAARVEREVRLACPSEGVLSTVAKLQDATANASRLAADLRERIAAAGDA